MNIKNKMRIVTLIASLLPTIILLLTFQKLNPQADASIRNLLTAELAIGFCMGMILPYFFGKWLILSAVKKIQFFCEQMQKGQYDARLPLTVEKTQGEEENELHTLMRTLNWMARQIEVRQQELEHSLDALNQAKHDMEQLAMTDALTQLPNRRAFFLRFEKDCQQLDAAFGLCLLDIDFFKKINDTYGHDHGDIVLQAVGKLFREQFQTVYAARVGGEEFAILIQAKTTQAVFQAADHIRQAIAQLEIRTLTQGKSIPVTVSIGCCFAQRFEPQQLLFPHVLYKTVDLALYAAKESGRNRVVFQEIDVTDAIG